MKWRFISALMSVTLLVLLVQDIPLGFYLQQVEHERIITSLERDAFILAGRSEQALETETVTDDSELIQATKDYRDAGGSRVVIVNADGTAVVISDDDQADLGTSYLNRPEIVEALSGTISTGHRFSTTLNQELLFVAVPILSGTEVLGAVRLTYPDYVVANTVNEQLGLLSLVAVIALLLAAIVGYIVSGSITRRIRLLQSATESLAAGELDTRADESAGTSELRSLATSFNDMAARLELLITQQRTFAADASHQLRTPLTALRLRLERAHDLLESDPAGAAERLSAAEAEADRLSNLIEGLLLLSRTEASNAQRESVDLAAVTRGRIEQWQALAAESDVALGYDGPLSLKVSAVPTAVEQIVDNYIDNALSVSSAGSIINVHVRMEGTSALLEVLDQGPGLSPEECVRAFDRFWRASSDRHGSGLGLAIVAQLARASGGKATLHPRPGGGLIASVSFDTARN
ncbi:ATP-binding protein [Aurantimicrobium photophilum]|uniref:histidine kinase n=1 Tax=Aurantimicrobium photophilum TaxID=1987356 RepID=A0A2Z3S916_9MICO|nr:ATP-binding protein [Aurantimicrobium photophilum]AWR22342.1 Signal transduction histidine-protein kinase ArlS [Aurantimicrobium photophilum]